MKTRRGSSLWPTTLSGATMVNQYKPGDIVTSSLTRESDFIGVVRGVDPKINKVWVAWAGGAVGQHDPDEIHFEPHQSETVKSRMASRRLFADRTAATHQEISKGVRPSRPCKAGDLFHSGRGLQCGNCGAYTEDHGKTWEMASEGKSRRSAADPATDPQFVGDPAAHGMDKPIGGGFSIMQNLVKDQRQEMHEESQGGQPKMAASFKPGDEVEIAINSGLDSGKRGKVVSQREVKTDGQGIPSNIEGAYKPVNWKKEVAIRLDDGELITMFKNRVKKASEPKSRHATGEMGSHDIQPGGEHYGWAQDVEKAAKKIQRFTKNKVRFKEMRPFDVYQGPYALLTSGKLWSGEREGEYFFDYQLGAEKGVTGTPEEIAEAILSHLKSRKGSDEGLRSRRAMYWSNPDRIYRLTKREIVDSSALCPRCRVEMSLEPYTKNDRMYCCSQCKFKIPKSNVIVASLKSRRAAVSVTAS